MRERTRVLVGALGAFALGATVGRLWEGLHAPSLQGASPGPLRPIYGVGALLSTPDFLTNLAVVAFVEQRAGLIWPCWDYTGMATSVTRFVRADYSLVMANIMTRWSLASKYDARALLNLIERR